jgi:hypothetical protein
MSGGAATYYGNAILDLIGQGFTPPATVYWALFSVAPTDTTSGTELTAGAAPGYARVAVTNNATQFPNASSATKAVANAVVFPTNSGGGAWPAVVAWALFDASTAGNMLIWGTANSLACPAGQAITIPASTTFASVA